MQYQFNHTHESRRLRYKVERKAESQENNGGATSAQEIGNLRVGATVVSQSNNSFNDYLNVVSFESS